MRLLSFRSKRGVAALLVAMLAFMQAELAFAACQMDRGTMARAMAAQPNEPCGGCDTAPRAEPDFVVGSACVAHCTSDLQIPQASTPDLSAAADAPVLVLPRAWPVDASPPRIFASPPRVIPARVLLHSYLI